jgi:hypothetical protein
MQALKALNLLSAHKIDKSIVTWQDLVEDGIMRIHNQEGGSFQTILPSIEVSSRERLRRALSMDACGVRDVDDAMQALEWLGVTPALEPVIPLSGSNIRSEEQPGGSVEISSRRAPMTISGDSPIDALSALMTEHKGLAYHQGERDMVAMYHTVVGVMPDGSEERHTSRLMAFGAPTKGKGKKALTGGQEGQEGVADEEEGDSAMSATVGYTTAAAVELLLHLNPAQSTNSDHDLEGPGSGVRNGLGGRAGVLIPITPDIYEPILNRLNDFGITWTETITVTHKQL